MTHIFRLLTLGLLFSLMVSNATAETDPLNGRIAEVVTLFGSPPSEEGPLPRVRFYPTALVYGHLCFPSAVGREGTRLGVPVTEDYIGPRPAIECIGLHQNAVNIAFAFTRVDRVAAGPHDTLFLMRGNDEVMELRLLN